MIFVPALDLLSSAATVTTIKVNGFLFTCMSRVNAGACSIIPTSTDNIKIQGNKITHMRTDNSSFVSIDYRCGNEKIPDNAFVYAAITDSTGQTEYYAGTLDLYKELYEDIGTSVNYKIGIIGYGMIQFTLETVKGEQENNI